MSVKRYTAAGSGVMRTDPKGGYVNYSDYLELANQPDPLTAYLYAAELAKDEVKRLKAEVKELTLIQIEALNERNKAEAEVERLRKAGDKLAGVIGLPVNVVQTNALVEAWNAAKEGKQS